MNKKLLLATALAALTATTVSASSWRINADARKMPNFIDINAAMASEDVQAGDTLYLDPGSNIGGTQNVTKRVTIIGLGFNGAILPYGFATISGALYLKAANTKVVGVYITGGTYIGADYVTIERCRLKYIGYNGNNCRYADIRNCYVYRNDSYSDLIQGKGNTSNETAFWTIENSIIWQNNNNTYNCIKELYNATIRNNLIINNSSYTSSGCSFCLYNVGNSQIINNIIIQTAQPARAIHSSVSTDQLNNNVLSGNTRPEYNRCNVLKLDSVFTGGYQEYVLTDDSPARGYGQDTKDCGLFGGLFPYVKGGQPYGHPFIEQYNISSRPEDGKVNVSLKIKMQDE